MMADFQGQTVHCGCDQQFKLTDDRHLNRDDYDPQKSSSGMSECIDSRLGF